MTEPLVNPPAADEPTPDSRMCTCSMHCVESPYHERACCTQRDCGCWCHKLARPVQTVSAKEYARGAAIRRYLTERGATIVPTRIR